MIEYFLPVIFLCAFWLTYLFRGYAIKRNMIDIPGERSLHVIPTPRGGGLAIAIVFLVVLVGYGLWYFFVAGAIVALIGWLDDHGHVSPGIRLTVHFVAAYLVLLQTDGLPQIFMFGAGGKLGVVGDMFAAITIVWILNLFNFMDGIDGLAASEVVFSSFAAGIIIWVIFGYEKQGVLFFNLSAACLGFFMWNFPKAKIFLGDVGSGFLGLMSGAFIMYSANLESKMVWLWLILLGVFIVDSTYTLTKRIIRGDKIYMAHKMHAYQHASNRYGSHIPVTIGVILINVFWLAPMAWVVANDYVDGAVGLLISYTPLLFVAKTFRAGEPDTI